MSNAQRAGDAPIGIAVEAGKSYWWCSCGKSANQPFCDGSHKGSSVSPIGFVADEDKTAWLCGCKHTSGQPFCDGTHSKL